MRWRGDYPKHWRRLATIVKENADWRCERCGRAHDPDAGYALTVHHLDHDKSNCRRYNLAALCQRCHLAVEGTEILAQLTLWGMPWLNWRTNEYVLSNGGVQWLCKTM